MSADLTERLAAVLAEHREFECFTDETSGGVWRNYACSCGWWSTADQQRDFRAHVAAMLAEAGVGFVGEVGRDESEGWASYAAEQERHDETKAALDDLRTRVRALADEWDQRAERAERGQFNRRERWAPALRKRADEIRALLDDGNTP